MNEFYVKSQGNINYKSDLCLFSDIHSLSENESSAEGVYSMFVALQENPSLQKLEWVQPFLYLLLVNILHWLKWCYILHGWLHAFLTHDHGSNENSPFAECAYQNIHVISWTTFLFFCLCVICHSAASVTSISQIKELTHLVELYEWTRAFRS